MLCIYVYKRASSLNLVEFLDSTHESSHTHFVIINRLDASKLNHHLFRSIVDSVEFANFVRVAYFFKKIFDFLTSLGLLKVEFGHVKFLISWRKEEINSFWLITVVIVVCHRFELFEGNICPDSRTTECAVRIFRASHHIAGTGLDTFAKISIRLKLFSIWLSMQATSSVPNIITHTINVSNTESKVFRYRNTTSSKISWYS